MTFLVDGPYSLQKEFLLESKPDYVICDANHISSSKSS